MVQANSEVSALLGRIPSAVGYQPTLSTDLGMLQERITTTTKGSITSVQVPPACSPLLSCHVHCKQGFKGCNCTFQLALQHKTACGHCSLILDLLTIAFA